MNLPEGFWKREARPVTKKARLALLPPRLQSIKNQEGGGLSPKRGEELAELRVCVSTVVMVVILELPKNIKYNDIENIHNILHLLIYQESEK